MKKLLLLFLTILLCYSCEIQYDGKTRIVAQGQLIDRNNNPISDKRIEINTYSDGTYSRSDLISYANTDSEGKFTLVFPAPKSDDIDIIVTLSSIYTGSYNGTSPEYQPKQIKAQKRNFVNYKLDLNKIPLYKKDEITQLEVVLNKTTNTRQITKISVDGLLSDESIDLNQKDQNHYINTLFNVVKNQNIKLSYTVEDYSDPTKLVRTNHEAVVTINSEKVIHTITY
ncbi:hypothetical protein ACFFLS_22480 [Flavobacterium procerum]|uniref:Carboxypeptidase regulatory-like domain-containing protein n=1 Tax=Flavobacterium procerum TaxID=1455569 RepID=A0ABV6BYQ7_9FLAO